MKLHSSLQYFILRNLVMAFIILISSQVSYSQTSVTYTTSGSYVVPAGITSVTVEAWGGGGAGGGQNNNKDGGGGGGGGAYSKKLSVPVVPGNSYNVVVGAGGIGVTGNGADGGDSYFNNTTTILAKGGKGGFVSTGTPPEGGLGGKANESIGDYLYSGGQGEKGENSNQGRGGYGGSSAGPNAIGFSGPQLWSTVTYPTASTPVGGGNGGNGGNFGVNGSVGISPGGGGGGSGEGNNKVGGNGADGQIIINYTCSTYSISGVSGTGTCAASGTSTVTITSTASGLPKGTYTVTYNLSNPSVTSQKATMQVTTAGIGTFTANGLTSPGTCTLTIIALGSGSSNGTNILCSNTINSNNTASILVTAVPSQPSTINGNTAPCEGSVQTYSVTSVAGVTYNWTLPVGWAQTSGGTSNSITVTVGSGSGTIQVTPYNSCGNGIARTLAVSVTSVDILGFSGSRCGAGTGSITLSAESSTGTIKWFDANGNYLAMGTTYLTPVLNSTTTYYAEATSGSCTSRRIPVIAYIITPPSLSASGGGTYCYGTNISLSSTLSGADNVYWEGPNKYYSTLKDPVLTSATPSMSGIYTVNSNALSGINLVTNGDFEAGRTGFTSGYTYKDSTATGTYGALTTEGTYTILCNPNNGHTNFSACPDHSVPGKRQLVVNGAITANVTIWRQTVNVVPYTYYQFTYWVQSVVAGTPSQLQLYVNNVAAGPVYTASTTTCNWTQFLYNWSSGANTQAVLELRNQATDAGGNDFALDDIVFQHTCPSIATVNITVNDDVTSGSIAGNSTICYGYIPSPLTSSTAGTGSGIISYEWEANSSSSYVTIPGATAATYTPSALMTTTKYRRRTVSKSGGTTCYSSYTNEVTITVSGPSVNAGGPNTICQSNNPTGLQLIGASYTNATGAAWSIVSGGGSLSNVNTTTAPSDVYYTPAINYSGTVVLRLITSGGTCNAISDRIITIIPSANAVAGTAITTCSNSGAVNITAGSNASNYASVTWTSNGTGTFANANSLTLATYTPSAADITAGSRILTLTALGNSPCGNAISTKTLTITPLPSATISYPGSPFCNSLGTVQLVTRTGTAGGSYSSSPSGLSINALTGDITPSLSTVGNYTVIYTMASTGGCTAQTATATVTITALPSATISYSGSQFCQSVTTPQAVTRTGTAGGSYSASPAGLSINASNGAITPSSSAVGTYTVTYTIAALGGCSTVTATSTITILPDGSWTGAVNQDWNDPRNWACNQLPTLSTNVNIASGLTNYPIVSTNPIGMARDISIAGGASVTVNGGTLQIAKDISIANSASVTVTGGIVQVSGNISNSGIFNAKEGTIEMNGSAVQNIGADLFKDNTILNLTINNLAGVTLLGPLNVTGVVKATNGNLQSGGNLTLVSTPDQTALIDGSGAGNVLGKVNIQRYLPNSFGYKYFSSPFTSATVAELADEVVLGEPFPTFYKYDEDHHRDSLGITVYYSGWTPYNETTNALVPMNGYAANLGTGTDPKTVTMSGVVNNGNLSTPIYNHNRKYTKGFNLVGNPYPSPINWDATEGWTKTNVDNAIYFFKAGNTDRYTGTYLSYVNGKSTGSGDNIIAAMQGFFVHVSNGTVSTTLGVNNAARVNDLKPMFKAATIDSRPTLRLKVGFEIKNALYDAAVIYFDEMAGKAFEQDKDALKLNNTDLLVPNIYTLSPEGCQLSINGLPLASDSVSSIPVGITTFTSGWINLRAENVNNLFLFEQVILKDALTGKSHDLRLSPDVRFYLDKGQYDRRFSLLFSKEPGKGNNALPEKLFTVVRSGNLVLVKVNLANNMKGNLLVTNMLGQTLLRKEVFEKETVEITQGTGVYVITLVSGKLSASEKILMRTDYE